MLPGMGAMKQLKNANIDERQLDRTEAIILSMTPAERHDPTLIKGKRRKRIADGSGRGCRRCGRWSSSSTRCG